MGSTVNSAPLDLPTDSTVNSAPLDLPMDSAVNSAPLDLPTEFTVNSAPQDLPTEFTVNSAPLDLPTEFTVNSAPQELPMQSQTYQNVSINSGTFLTDSSTHRCLPHESVGFLSISNVPQGQPNISSSFSISYEAQCQSNVFNQSASFTSMLIDPTPPNVHDWVNKSHPSQSLSFHSSLFSDLSESESSFNQQVFSQSVSFIQTTNSQLSSTPARPRQPMAQIDTENMPSPIQVRRASSYFHNQSGSENCNVSEMKHGKKKTAKRKLANLDPLDKDEEAQFDEYFIRKVHNSSNPSMISVRSGTHTMRYQHVPKVYVSTENASARTVRRRAAANEKYRKNVQSKLSKELLRLPKNEMVSECKDAGVTVPHINKEEGLALKVAGGFSWDQCDTINKVLGGKGVSYDGPAKVREYRKSLLGGQLESTMVDFKFKDTESPYAVDDYVTKPAPCTSAKSMKDSVIDRLNRLNEKKLLTWYNNKMPENEVWLKINGDKGGGSTKCGFQIVNRIKPNSPDNNVLFCTFEAPDNYSNLRTALAPYAEEIIVIREITWNGKKIRILGSGDIDFISKSEGIPGASGTCPCYICVITRSEMQLFRDDRLNSSYPIRTIERLQEQHQKYVKDGAIRSNQAQYENVVEAMILPIKPEDWCPPGLHLTTGAMQRIHGHLVIDVSGLDLDIGNDLAQFAWTVGNARFDAYISTKREIFIIQEHQLEIEDN